jgi:hypothetical protein
MNNLATMLVDLLCHITAEPDGGHDPDATADLQIDSWQVLINDLDSAEKKGIKIAATKKLALLQDLTLISPEQEQLIGILDAYINDELQ